MKQIAEIEKVSVARIRQLLTRAQTKVFKIVIDGKIQYSKYTEEWESGREGKSEVER